MILIGMLIIGNVALSYHNNETKEKRERAEMLRILNSCGCPDDILVNESFKREFDTLISIYERNNIKIKYRKISTISDMKQLPKEYEPYVGGLDAVGLYYPYTREIYVKSSGTLTHLESILSGKYFDFVTLILAHEIAHSQGYDHHNDTVSILYPDIKYILDLLDKHTLEELVVNTYTEKYSPYIPKTYSPFPIPSN